MLCVEPRAGVVLDRSRLGVGDTIPFVTACSVFVVVFIDDLVAFSPRRGTNAYTVRTKVVFLRGFGLLDAPPGVDWEEKCFTRLPTIGHLVPING